jgi:hypothetical protein
LKAIGFFSSGFGVSNAIGVSLISSSLVYSSAVSLSFFDFFDVLDFDDLPDFFEILSCSILSFLSVFSFFDDLDYFDHFDFYEATSLISYLFFVSSGTFSESSISALYVY